MTLQVAHTRVADSWRKLGRPVMETISKRWVRLFLLASGFVWYRLPAGILRSAPATAYGRLIQRVVRAHCSRDQNPRTYFLRNRPELDVVSSLLDTREHGATVNITVIACSMGAEPYSLFWAIKKRRPDLEITMHAIDILPEVVDIAREGRWDPSTDHLERLVPGEIDQLFDREGSMLRVKEWLRSSVQFEVGDGTDPAFIARLGPQDLVVANRFLTHMHPLQAESALRRLSALVRAGGHLVCTGVDVDVRTRVMTSLGWTPILDRVEELHDGDETQRGLWPWEYWALEPLDKRFKDWPVRYATIFQRPG